MTETLKPDAKPVPLYEAAASLTAICAQIEESGDIDAALSDAFSEADAHLVASVDRRKAVAARLLSEIALAKDYRGEVDLHVKRLERILAALKEHTKAAIVKNPDLHWRDRLGKRVSVCPAAPIVKLEFEARKTKSVSNILDEHMIALLGIEERYVQEWRFLRLNMDQVKADLAAGREVPWASLQQNTSLRGL